jgi:probable HAF family extracellular repeat protein
MKQRVVVAFVLLLVPIASAQVYTITDLGPLSPTAINTWGQVVGNLNGHAFIWAKSQGMRDLGTLTGGTLSSAAAINDLGAVTGTADGPATVVGRGYTQQCSDLTQPFIWTRGNGMQGLGAVGGPDSDPFDWCNTPFYATGINDFSQVVGYDEIYLNDYQFGFLWTSADGMTLFGGSWPPTFANKISNTGQIVGQNSDAATWGIGHATSWKSGVATDLGTLGGGADVVDYASSANGVNDLGQVVGWSTTTSVSGGAFGWCGSSAHAVIWTGGGGIRDLGTLPGDTLSAALKINFFGQVLGSSGNAATCGISRYEVFGRPFIWSERNGMRDLNTLIRASSGWVLNSVSDINLWGQIVGSGTRNGQPHGFLLTPRVFYWVRVSATELGENSEARERPRLSNAGAKQENRGSQPATSSWEAASVVEECPFKSLLCNAPTPDQSFTSRFPHNKRGKGLVFGSHCALNCALNG